MGLWSYSRDWVDVLPSMQENPGGILITAVRVSIDRFLQDAPIHCLPFDRIGVRFVHCPQTG